MRSGETEVSFEDFVRARSDSLLRTALLLTGQRRAEAEDLLQIALERAYRHWPRICGSEGPERYVHDVGRGPVPQRVDDRSEFRHGWSERGARQLPRREDLHMRRWLGDVHGERSSAADIRCPGRLLHLEHPERHRGVCEPPRLG